MASMPSESGGTTMADTIAPNLAVRTRSTGIAAAIAAIGIAFPLGFGVAKWTTHTSSSTPAVVAPAPADAPCHMGRPC
jgi:hypothetical protein